MSGPIIKGPEREIETVDWLLAREHVYRSREDAITAIQSGKVTINGKIVKDIKYKPKKKDGFQCINPDNVLIFFNIEK
jgi:predicted rRNA methylase YqxC with S4 and FtsJ domains